MTCAVARERLMLANVSVRYIVLIHRADTGLGGGDMSSGQLYDTIGATYTATRRTEPRIAAQI